MQNESKWAVTGAAGFLGSHVIEQLLQQEQCVLGIDNMSWGKKENIAEFEKNPNFTDSRIDIRESEELIRVFREFEPQYVVHLAALHFIPDAIKNPSLAVSINVHGTQSVLEAARVDSVQKLWFASTGDVYQPSEEAHHEKSTTSPFNIYGLTKFLGEQLIELESNESPNKSFIIGRLFNLIGTRETNPHILPEIFRQLKEDNTQLKLGNIWPLRDLVPISEAAHAIIEMTLKEEQKIAVYNLATGHSQSIEHVINTIADILGHEIKVEKDPERVRKAERAVLSSDVSKLREFIGWSPTHDLRKELADLLKFEGLL